MQRAWSALEARRRTRLDSAAVAVVAHWPQPDGSHGVDASLFFLDDDGDAPWAYVLGRHSSADSAPLPGSSLRHAVVLAWPCGPREAPRVEVLDLNTGVGLGVAGGRAAAHLESMGPVRFGVGAADVVVVPLGRGQPVCPEGAQALLDRLAQAPAPVRRFHEGTTSGAPLADVLAWHARLVGVGGGESGRRSRSIADGEPLPRPGSLARRGLEGERSTPGWQARTIVTSQLIGTPERVRAWRLRNDDDDCDGDPVTLTTTWDALHEGVLIGRYERCAAHGGITDDGVSRVHALLLARRDRLFVVDTGSTNGTCVRRRDDEELLGAPHRAAHLDDDARLYLHRTRCMVAVVADERLH